MWEWEFLGIGFERGWNCENDLRVRDLKERLVAKIGTLGVEFWEKSESWVIWEIEIMKVDV